ncbi:hypothetical protein Aph01nite_74590 [Acrocarpospora phusangensis]|uniref:Uncharacterized protein n=1 Tax=Acrocarpospora phusangensis TaxID=1070424 RepID=A0A919UPT7_9ACTN|nr:hypothetical protein Aph01nite_74590 [Acrocarpospora phusangensis]
MAAGQTGWSGVSFVPGQTAMPAAAAVKAGGGCHGGAPGITGGVAAATEASVTEGDEGDQVSPSAGAENQL